MVLGKISHLTCEHNGPMQGITPEPAGSWGRFHTLFVMFIYIWCNINRRPNKFFCVWNNEAVPMAHSSLLWLEARSYWVQILVGSDVPIQCSKLFKGMECAVMYMALCTIKNPWSYSIRLGHSPFLPLRYCHDFAESNVKQYSLEITTRV